MFHRHLKATLFPLLAFLLFPFALAPAQSAKATLSGEVMDERGAMVSGATVLVVNTSTGVQRQATTNDGGFFTIPLLPPGTYTLMVRRDGFAPVEIKNVALNVNDQRTLQIPLRVGKVDETINVEATVGVQESAAVGLLIERQFVANLPLNGRSLQSLLTLTPGVVLTKSNFNEQGQFSVNGQRANANYFMVDGVGANIGVIATMLGQTAGGSLPATTAFGGTNNLVSVDALQEFKIQTSVFAPEFGRTPGGQISIVTRSGTNRLGGTLYEYFRHEALDANDWFNNARNLAKPTLRQHDFGFVLGGPILFPPFNERGRKPWYDGRHRTFFFLSYEGLRLRLPQTKTTEVPSLAARQDPRVSAELKRLLNSFPVPNGRGFANGLATYSASYSDPASLNATSVRLDHSINSKLSLFGRYSHAPSETFQRGAGLSLGGLNRTRGDSRTITLGVTQTITTTAGNEFRVNYSRVKASSSLWLDSFGGASPPPDSLLFTSHQDAVFVLTILGGTSTSFLVGENANNSQRQINLVDNLSFMAGSHRLKFGIDYRRLSPISRLRGYQQNVTFNGIDGITAGRADVTISASDPMTLVFRNLSAYGQDTWRVTTRLTFTYGLRWEVNPSPSGKDGKDLVGISAFNDPSHLTLAPQGAPLYQTSYHNFAPRIGAAYQLSERPGKETVLRGGFGVFYDLGFGSVGNATASFPFARTKILTNVTFPLTPDQLAPLPFSLDPPLGSITTSDPELKLPRTYQWNATVEQSLGAGQIISASYIAAAGRRLLRQERLMTTAGLSASLFGPDSAVTITRNSATSDYRAFQLQFQRHLSRGLQALASYTLSRSVDTASNDSLVNPPGERIAPGTDRGPSDFDVRHAFAGAVTYNILSSGNHLFSQALLRHWSIDTIVAARSATPVNITVMRNLGFGPFSFRPDLVPGVPLYLDDPLVGGGKRINPAAFTSSSMPRQGNLGRNALRGFSVYQVDLALRRQFDLGERVNLQFRAEFFNAFNHPNFADPPGSLGSVSASGVLVISNLFGQSSQMLGRGLGSGGVFGGFSPLYQIGGPRSIQLALKLNF